MARELQDIVDTLAAELDRGVAIDDRHLRLVSHSAHRDDVDSVRRRSIMTRGVGDDVRRWVFGYGVADAHAPVRMRANPAVSAAARVCAPIRCRDLLLGFLFVVDAQESITDDEVQRCHEAALEAGETLYEQRFLQHRDRWRERELLRNLVDADASVRARVATTLIDEGFLGSTAVVAVAVGAADRDGPSNAEELALPFASIIDHVRRAIPPHTALGASRPRNATLIVETQALERAFGGCDRFATWLRDLTDKELEPIPGQAVVGRGEAVDELTSAWRSCEQATRALLIATRVPQFDRVVAWKDAGVYRVLAHVAHDDAIAGCDPRLLPLLEHEDLLRTLEVYLDLAGDAKATSAALALHRASLYYRLQKIEQLSGASLKSGEDRLALHLGLKLLHLAAAAPGR
jgi:hypothetical protein